MVAEKESFPALTDYLYCWQAKSSLASAFNSTIRAPSSMRRAPCPLAAVSAFCQKEKFILLSDSLQRLAGTSPDQS